MLNIVVFEPNHHPSRRTGYGGEEHASINPAETNL